MTAVNDAIADPLITFNQSQIEEMYKDSARAASLCQNCEGGYLLSYNPDEVCIPDQYCTIDNCLICDGSADLYSEDFAGALNDAMV